MSVESYQPGNYTGLETGLDDFDNTDLTLPRLRIMHPEGKFYNPSTDEEFEYLDCIVLGFVKQRVMFDPVYDDSKQNQSPWCKSNDFTTGFPGEEFPWDHYSRDKTVLELSPNGNSCMPCNGCDFQKWGTKDPKTNKAKPPRCNELHTYAILYYNPANESYNPAVISFKSTSIKPSQNYLQGFKTSGKPTFTQFTRIELNKMRRGMTNYSVAKFSVTGETPTESWIEYSSQSLAVREMLRAEPPVYDEENPEDDNVVKAQAKPQAQTQAPAPAAPAQGPWADATPQAPAPGVEDQVIEGEIVPPTAPAAPAPTAPPARTAPPAPAAPAAHAPQGRSRPTPPPPPAPGAPRANAAPKAPAPAPVAPVAQAAPVAQHDDDDDGMPF